MEGLHEARGRCGGPFPPGSKYAAAYRMEPDSSGRLWVKGGIVMGGQPKFDAYSFDRCPLALIGAAGCPAPVSSDWLPMMFQAAAVMKEGGTVRDLVSEPAPPLVDGALAVLSEWRAIEAQRIKERRAKDSARQGMGG